MIKYYKRKINKYEIEKVSGEKYIKWLYNTPIGTNLLELLIKKKLFSKVYGYFCDSKLSINKISSFIHEFNIDTSIFEKKLDEFISFNDFFTRKLKKNARPINLGKEFLISPGDGRLLAYENIDLNKKVQVKGSTYSLSELINNDNISQSFLCGTCLILRLTPSDYHRFHFIDNGICEKSSKIKGDYYSVNPMALNTIPKVFCKNKREYSMFYTENFGNVLYIEVGATCVGSIIQTYQSKHYVKKGDEKGYFKFGGSTIILFFEKNRVKIDDDITNQTEKGYETLVLFGEEIGHV